MRHRNLAVVAAAVALLVLAACTSAPKRELSHLRSPFATLPNGLDPMNPDQLSPHASEAQKSPEGVLTYFVRKRGHALNVLELSGGGQNGAFGAGLLKGWREAGTRPQFDLVTGVSTGGLLSTHAFLGTPADDAVLEEIFTHTDSSDIYRKRSLWSIVTGTDSILDTSPLEKLLDKYITAEVLERVAAEYDEGRRLWVGTTNLDYSQTWVWDMTRIAKEGGPDSLELYRKVLRASAAPPIAFPAVEIGGHLFGDGGVRSNVVILGLAGKERPGPPLHGPGNVYLVHNGKLRHDPRAVTNDLKGLAGATLGAGMSTSMEFVIVRAYFAARSHGYTFNLVQIPDDVDVGSDSLAFDPKEMRAGFDAGYDLGKKPDPWAKVPPNLGDIPDWALEVIGEQPSD